MRSGFQFRGGGVFLKGSPSPEGLGAAGEEVTHSGNHILKASAVDTDSSPWPRCGVECGMLVGSWGEASLPQFETSSLERLTPCIQFHLLETGFRYLVQDS